MDGMGVEPILGALLHRTAHISKGRVSHGLSPVQPDLSLVSISGRMENSSRSMRTHNVATPARIELATSSFGNLRSIRVSYEVKDPTSGAPGPTRTVDSSFVDWCDIHLHHGSKGRMTYPLAYRAQCL